MRAILRVRWARARDEHWEQTVWWWGYTMCGWPHWFARWAIWRVRVKDFALGRAGRP